MSCGLLKSKIQFFVTHFLFFFSGINLNPTKVIPQIMEYTTSSAVDTTRDIIHNFSAEVNTLKTDIFMQEAETLITYKIAKLINRYWFPILVPIGLVGNSLSFFVMIKPNNRQLSTCIYMAAISINDNVMMLLAIESWLATEIKAYRRYPVQCKIISFLGLTVLQNSTFQILAMTVDKYIAIKWPHRAATYSAPRRAKLTIAVVCICVVIYNVPHFLASKLIGVQCIGFRAEGAITKVYSWLSFVLNAIIPFGLLIYMNFAIVETIQSSQKMFLNRDTTGPKSNSTNQIQSMNTGLEIRQSAMKNAENQLTIMLLLVTTLFLILLIPTYVRFVYLTFLKPDTPSKYAFSIFLMQLTYKLFTTNSGINFFLYCISGQKFRNELKEILCVDRNSQTLKIKAQLNLSDIA